MSKLPEGFVLDDPIQSDQQPPLQSQLPEGFTLDAVDGSQEPTPPEPIDAAPVEELPPTQMVEPQRQSTPAAMERMRQAQEEEASLQAGRQRMTNIAQSREAIQGPGMPLGEVATSAVQNIPSSGVQLVKDVTMPIRHPIETAKAVGTLAKGAAQKLIPGEQPAEQSVDQVISSMVDRYGGVENIKKTVAEDPVGFLGDVASIFIPAGAAGKLTGALGKVPALAKAGEVLSKAGEIIEPITTATKATKEAAAKIIPKDLPGKLYESAAKFKTSIPESDRLKMVDTALENSIMPTVKGLDKTRNMIDGLNANITTLIDKATDQGKRVNVRDLFKEFDSMKKELSGDPLLRAAQINRIEKSLKTYFKDLGKADLTPSEAQKLKQKIYKETGSFYSSVKEAPATVEAKQAVARAAKESIEEIFPEIKGLNKKEGALIALRNELERSASRISNRDLIGIGVPIKGGAGGAIAGPGGMGAGVVLGLLDTPVVKAKLAIVANRLKEKGVVIPEDSLMSQVLTPGVYSAALQEGRVSRNQEEETPQ